MTYNVFGGTLNLAQSINPITSLESNYNSTCEALRVRGLVSSVKSIL